MTSERFKKIEADIAFIRRVGELGESDRAVKMAKHLLPTVARDKLNDRAALVRCTDLRRILIEHLDWPNDSSEEKGERERNVLILVDELLSLREVTEAIEWLISLAEFYKDSRSWEIYERITDEFNLDRTPEVIEEVNSTFFKLIDICDNSRDDEEMGVQCKRWAKYLSSKHISASIASATLSELSEWMPDDGYSEILLEMAKIVYEAKRPE